MEPPIFSQVLITICIKWHAQGSIKGGEKLKDEKAGRAGLLILRWVLTRWVVEKMIKSLHRL